MIYEDNPYHRRRLCCTWCGDTLTVETAHTRHPEGERISHIECDNVSCNATWSHRDGSVLTPPFQEPT